MKEPIVGIDLGTTNSVIAYVPPGQEGQPVVIKDGDREILPSVVGLAPDGQLLVGEAARNQYLLYPEQTVKSIKRKMGTSERIPLGDKTYSPQEISGMILLRLRKIAEAHFGREVHRAVITTPAYFTDAQRKATKEAGEIAGWEVVRIINEPTAAALAYETGHSGSRKILVYDLGGGTFDVSVVNIQDDVVEVLSGHGNNHLGGDDFDDRIVQKLRKEFEASNKVDLASSARALARLTRAAENAKIHLSDHPFATVSEEYIIERKGVPLNLFYELSRIEYERMIQPYLDETLQSVHIALRDVGLPASAVEHILLVGGATRTPLVREMLAEKFDMEPRHEISPDLCVALGAAIQGAMIAGEPVSSVLVDITPYTFGTSVLGEVNGMPSPNQYVPLIHKNSSLPVSKSEVFATVVDNQEAVHVKVFQGENIDAMQNLPLGDFIVEGLSPVPAGNPIVLSFDLDLNGILHVSAMEKSTGLEKSINIENAMAELDAGQIGTARRRIGLLFGEDGSAVPTPVEMINDIDLELLRKAEALVDKAIAKLDEVTPEDRGDIEELLVEIRDHIQNGHQAALEASMANLEDILFFLDT